MYIENKDRFNSLKKHDKTFKTYFEALQYVFIPRWTHRPPHEKMKLLLDAGESGEISDDQFIIRAEELQKEYGWKNISERLGLHLIFRSTVMHASLLIAAAWRLNFSQESAHAYLAQGILFRSALDYSLRAMLFEHLLTRKFREQVQQKFWMGKKKDSVTYFVKRVTDTARKSRTSVEDIIEKRYHEHYKRPLILKFHDILEWLDVWGVFVPIPDARKKLKAYKVTLDKEVQGELAKSLMRMVNRHFRLDSALKEISFVIELLLLGTLNTAENVTRDSPKRFRSLKRVKGSNKNVYDEFLELLQKGRLKFAEMRLRDFATS